MGVTKSVKMLYELVLYAISMVAAAVMSFIAIIFIPNSIYKAFICKIKDGPDYIFMNLALELGYYVVLFLVMTFLVGLGFRHYQTSIPSYNNDADNISN